MPNLKALTQARIAIQNTVDNVKQYAIEINAKLEQNQAAKVDIEQIETRIEVLDKAWLEFRECNNAIKLTNTEDLDSYQAKNFENKYYESKSILKRILKKHSVGHTENGDTSNFATFNRSTFDSSHDRTAYQASEIRLPRVVIENFSGDYAKWPSFQDQFITSIHNNEQLPDIHKFQYIKSLLKGEAANVIRHFSLTEANYLTAWNKLIKRYDKKKYSVKAFIDLFMNQSTMQPNSTKQLRIICDNADECIRGLAALQIEGRDPWLIQILLKKLDMDTQQAWAEETVNKDTPTIDELIQFLTERCDAFDSCISSSTNRNNHLKFTKQSVQLYATQSNNTNNKCALCNSDHPLYKCFEYKKMKIDSRKQFLESNKLCHNCLSHNHSTDNCQSQNRCFRCNQKHHTTIHVYDQKQEANLSTRKKCGTQSYATSCSTLAIDPDSSPSKTSDAVTTINIPSTSTNINKYNNNTKISQNIITHSSLSISAPYSFDPSKILLSTILCYIIDDHGKPHICRALLDSGSQSTLITENCVQRIGLHRKHSAITVSGICYTKVESSKGETTITIISRHNKEYRLSINAVILNKLTPQLPSQQFDDHRWPVIQTLELADPAYNTQHQLISFWAMIYFWRYYFNKKSRSMNSYLRNQQILAG